DGKPEPGGAPAFCVVHGRDHDDLLLTGRSCFLEKPVRKRESSLRGPRQPFSFFTVRKGFLIFFCSVRRRFACFFVFNGREGCGCTITNSLPWPPATSSSSTIRPSA